MKTIQKRAAKGGEVGANGEWYEGGKFINTVAENAKRAAAARKLAGQRKVQIEDYVWVVAPHENATPIFPLVRGTVCKFVGSVAVPNNDDALAYQGYTREQAQEIASRWNAGERWL